MKFRIAEDEFEVESVDRLTLAHWMRIEKETAALGNPMAWGQVRALVERVSSLEEEEAVEDDGFPWLIGIVVWASRVEAGDRDLSLAEAVDFRMSDFEVLEDDGPAPATPAGPQDHRGSGGAARPRKSRPGSGRGASARAPRAPRTTSRSATPSSDA